LNQEEVIDSIRSRCQQIALEAEQVSITCIQTRDAAAAHGGDLVGHRETGDSGSAEVVIRDQECIGYRGQHGDLLANPT
jgi:hypothetical protein